MRVVLDTNTIISALFWGGVPWQVYDAAFDGKYILLTTVSLFNELETVIRRPKFVPSLSGIKKSADYLLTEYRELAEWVAPADIASNVIRDPKDRAVLACAVGGKADFVVSGDKDLLVLNTYQNIPMLTAAQFLERLSEK